MVYHDNNNEYDDDNDDDVGKRCHCPDWEAGGAGWATLFISQVTFSFKWNVSKCIIRCWRIVLVHKICPALH